MLDSGARAREEFEAPETTAPEDDLDLIEITDEQRLGREAAAARLRELADALARNNNVEFRRGDLRFTVRVPDEVELTLEVEIADDGGELELELSW